MNNALLSAAQAMDEDFESILYDLRCDDADNESNAAATRLLCIVDFSPSVMYRQQRWSSGADDSDAKVLICLSGDIIPRRLAHDSAEDIVKVLVSFMVCKA